MAVAGASGGVVGSAQTDVTNPYETISCGCIYCFVCIATRLEAEEGEGWTCLRCGKVVKECKPWSGDVLEEVPRPKSAKKVSFSDEEEAMGQDREQKLDEEESSSRAWEPKEKRKGRITEDLEESGQWARAEAGPPDEKENPG